MKSILSALFVTCYTQFSAAQVSITSADIAARITVGSSIINRADTLTTTANIGAPGGTANTWNFSALATDRLDTLQSVLPSGTPYLGWFPGTTHVLQSRQTLQGISGTGYQYLTLSTNLLNRGAGGNGQTPLGTAVLRMTNTPPDLFYQLPLSLNTTWTSTYVESLIVTVGGLPLLTQVTNHSITYTVDAHGTLTLPAPFGTQQALRVRSDDRYTGTAGSGRNIDYEFIAPNGASVQVRAVDSLQPNSGTITIDPYSTAWSGAMATGVLLSDETPGEFMLLQNYPNPFNPVTHLKFSIANSQLTILKVYDLLGREVATLVNEVKAPGLYEVSWDASGMASGVYIYRLQSGQNTISRKLLLLR